MFEAIRSNQRVAQIILAILIVPFAFFGMDAYFSDAPGDSDVAMVAGSSISMLEFEQALREQQDRLREASGGAVDRALLESEALRRSVLDNIINRRVLALYALENRFSVSAQELQETIASVPSFFEDGQFSLQRYEALLRAQGMTPAMFEARLAQDVRIQQLSMAVGGGAFVPPATARRLLLAQLEERSVRELRLSSSALGADATIDEAQIQSWYERERMQFQRPERIQAEFVVFDRAAVERMVDVSADEVRAFYEDNPERFGVGEERRARHILLELAADADDATVEQVTADAAALIAQLRQDPEQFAALAAEKSADVGTAARGGDLGFFGRGLMVGPFEDAVFALAEEEFAEPVRSQFGIHVIQLTDIKPATQRSLTEVQDEIADELRAQTASRLYAEEAEHFANLVYEQPDSLEPAAEALQVEIQRTDWISEADGNLDGFRNERLLSALFSVDAIQDGRNTEAIEVAPNTLLSARVRAHQAAQQLPLDEVREEIIELLRAEAGSKKAQEQGAALLAALEKGDAAEEEAARFGELRSLQRLAPGLPAAAMQAVFSAPSTRLPVHVGLSDDNGDYLIYRIEAVDRPQLDEDDPRIASVAEQYSELLAEQDFGAFIAELRKRYEVEVRAEALLAED